MLFKRFSYLSSDGHFIQQRRTVCAILVKAIIEIIFGKLFYLNLNQWVRRRCHLNTFLFELYWWSLCTILVASIVAGIRYQHYNSLEGS